MKLKCLILSLIFLCVSTAEAGIRPSFSLNYSSWNATHIVIATEGEEIDGKFTVLEPIKGDLGYGQVISIPKLVLCNESF